MAAETVVPTPLPKTTRPETLDQLVALLKEPGVLQREPTVEEFEGMTGTVGGVITGYYPLRGRNLYNLVRVMTSYETEFTKLADYAGKKQASANYKLFLEELQKLESTDTPTMKQKIDEPSGVVTALALGHANYKSLRSRNNQRADAISKGAEKIAMSTPLVMRTETQSLEDEKTLLSLELATAVETLTRTNDELRVKLEKVETEKAVIENRVSELEKAVDASEVVKNTLKDQLAETRKALEDSNTNVTDLGEKLAVQDALVEAQAKQVLEKSEKLKTEEEKVKKLEQEKVALQSQLNDTETLSRVATEKAENATAKIAEQKQALENLRAELESVTNESSTTKAHLTKHQNELAEIKTKEASSAETIKRQSTKIQELESRCAELETAQSLLIAEHKTCGEEINRLNTRLTIAENEVKIVKAEKDSAEAQSAKARTDVEQAKGELAEVTKRLNELTAEHEKCKTDLKSQTEQTVECKATKAAISTSQIDALEKQIKADKQKIDALEKQIKADKQKIENNQTKGSRMYSSVTIPDDLLPDWKLNKNDSEIIETLQRRYNILRAMQVIGEKESARIDLKGGKKLKIRRDSDETDVELLKRLTEWKFEYGTIENPISPGKAALSRYAGLQADQPLKSTPQKKKTAHVAADAGEELTDAETDEEAAEEDPQTDKVLQDEVPASEVPADKVQEDEIPAEVETRPVEVVAVATEPKREERPQTPKRHSLPIPISSNVVQ